MPRPRLFGRWIWLWLACYVLLMAAAIWWLVAARGDALAESAAPEGQSDWQTWREDVERQQSEPTPVRRRVPESIEPPAVVLLRDHFGAILAGSLVLTSVLYWVTAWMVSGALAAKSSET
jgi:hypothetical protein